MTVRDILLLGNPQLYEISKEVNQQGLESLKPEIADLHDTMMAFRKKWGVGRAIADGIAVRNPVPEALHTMKTTVDDIVQVSDQAILEAMKTCL